MNDKDEQLFLLAMGFTLEEKIAKSIANIQYYEHKALELDPVNGYFACNSYGKDSGCIMELLKMAKVKYKGRHALTTIDPPELIRFGRKRYPNTVEDRPKVPLLVRLVQKNNGPPTRISRWCCAEYKETKGTDMVKVFGVRAAESPRRSATWQTWQRWRNGKGFVLNPILYWSDDDVWKFHKLRSLPYCELYDQGFKRLGCVGCPMADQQRIKEFERWPGYERAWKHAITKFYNNWHGVPRNDGKPRWFDHENRKHPIRSAEDMWDWWMQIGNYKKARKNKDDEGGCQLGLF